MEIKGRDRKKELRVMQEEVRLEKDIGSYVMDYYDTSGSLCATVKIILANDMDRLGKKLRHFKNLCSSKYKVLFYDIDFTQNPKKYLKTLLKKRLNFPNGVMLGHKIFSLSTKIYKGDRIFRNFAKNVSFIQTDVRLANFEISSKNFAKILCTFARLETLRFRRCKIVGINQINNVLTKSKILRIIFFQCAGEEWFQEACPSFFNKEHLYNILNIISCCVCVGSLKDIRFSETLLNSEDCREFKNQHPNFSRVKFDICHKTDSIII
ncbi:unnamed protein product [Moneuplotes crassus]|uniref:Uncharacterized protein n=1 Tax=Euplotes crassus TaxID=5936 RepID=A0AAD2D324_EUPCR|nr:unnamed protein product [Moneuplotes crassus]